MHRINYRPTIPFQQTMECEQFLAFSVLIGIFFRVLAKARAAMKGVDYAFQDWTGKEEMEERL